MIKGREDLGYFGTNGDGKLILTKDKDKIFFWKGNPQDGNCHDGSPNVKYSPYVFTEEESEGYDKKEDYRKDYKDKEGYGPKFKDK